MQATAVSARQSLAVKAALVVSGILVLAISARIWVHVPGVLAPITAQTLAVLLVGGLLGSRMGTMSVAGYLLAGAVGLPMFVHGGGPAYLFGPTGGYLLGFLPAAWLMGAAVERGAGSRLWALLPALLAADAVIFAFGLLWSSLYLPLAALPFELAGLLPGEAIKIVLSAAAIFAANSRGRK